MVDCKRYQKGTVIRNRKYMQTIWSDYEIQPHVEHTFEQRYMILINEHLHA